MVTKIAANTFATSIIAPQVKPLALRTIGGVAQIE